MTKLDYKNSTVNLYEDYIVISTYNDERTLYKKDIASFLLDLNCQFKSDKLLMNH